MRILIVTFDPPENIGGVEGRAIGYTKQLVKMGEFVELIALAPHYKFSSESFYGAKLHKYPSTIKKILAAFRSAVREIASNSIDSVFLLSGGITLLGILLLLYLRLAGVKSAIFFYGKDILTAKKSPASFLALILALFLTRRIGTNSAFTASLLPRAFSSKLNILYPAVDPEILESFAPQQRPKDMKRILFVGRLVRRKGVDDLLGAFGSLVQEVRNIELEIVGHGPEIEALQKLARGLDIEEMVHFTGELSGPPLYQRYSVADVFVMPSKRFDADVEGFGTVFLEAGLFGKPSIGTWSGGIPEAVLHGETGILVREEDLGDLEQWMHRLLTDSAIAERLGQAARTRVLENFTWQKSTEALVRLFEDD